MKKTVRNSVVSSYDRKLALIEKLEKENVSSQTQTKRSAIKEESFYREITSRTERAHRNYRYLIELFPDIEIAIDIMTAFVLMPHDLKTAEITYRSNKSDIPAGLKQKLLSVTSKHIDETYQLTSKLDSMYKEAKFMKGAVIRAVFPMAVVNDIISRRSKVVMHSTDSSPVGNYSMGLLGPKGVAALQSADGSDVDLKVMSIDVTDDPTELLHAKISKNERSRNIDAALLSFSYGRNVDKDDDGVMKLNPYSNNEIEDVKGMIVMDIPMKSCIVVHTPGKPSEHVAYIILLDDKGYPLSEKSQSSRNVLSGLDAQSDSGLAGLAKTTIGEAILKKAKEGMYGKDCPDVVDNEMSARVYEEALKTELKNMAESGLYKEGVEIGGSEGLYRLAMAHTLAENRIKMVFVPKEMVDYLAFDYYSNGIGKSKLEDIMTTASLAAALLFSSTSAEVRNNVSRTRATISIDEDDPDVRKTTSLVKGDILKANQLGFPARMLDPAKWIEWIHRASVEIAIEEHPGLPNTKVSYEHIDNNTRPAGDIEQQEKLISRIFKNIGTPPEFVESGFGADFATVAESNRIIMTKRASSDTKVMSDFTTNHCRKIAISDTNLHSKLEEIMEEDMKNVKKSLTADQKKEMGNDKEKMIRAVMEDFLTGVTATLPIADTTTAEGLREQFDNYTESMEKAIESWITTDFVDSEMLGELGENVDAVKSALLAYYQRKWSSENGYLPELTDILSSTSDKSAIDVPEEMAHHGESVLWLFSSYLEKIRKVAKEGDKKAKKLDDDSEEQETDDGDAEDVAGTESEEPDDIEQIEE